MYDISISVIIISLLSAGDILVTEDLSSHTTVGYDISITVDDGKNTVGPRILTVILNGICYFVLLILVFGICDFNAVTYRQITFFADFGQILVVQVCSKVSVVKALRQNLFILGSVLDILHVPFHAVHSEA